MARFRVRTYLFLLIAKHTRVFLLRPKLKTMAKSSGEKEYKSCSRTTVIVENMNVRFWPRLCENSV